MAVGFGNTFRKNLTDYIFRKGTDPMSGVSSFWISLHTGDPGPDGQTSNEVTGGSYARVELVLTGGASFAAASTADPSVTSNSVTITFPTATGDWGAVTYFGIWNHASNTAAANFIGRAPLTSSQAIANTNTASFAIGALTHSFDGNFNPTP